MLNREREERKKILAAGMRQILDAADRAGRQTLTRTEQKKSDVMERECDAIAAAVRHEEEQRRKFDPRSAQGDQRLQHEYEDGSTLAPEERLADWASSRGGDPLDGERLSLGATVQARVRGDHRHLTDVERRVMGEGTDAAGGVLIPEQLSARIIDRARSQSVAIQAGAVTVPMASDVLVLARLAGGNTATWHAENAADITASDQTWERLELKAKTVVVEQKMSAELVEDLSDQGRRAIEHEIAMAIALKLDLAALEGDPAVDANSPAASLPRPAFSPSQWAPKADELRPARAGALRGEEVEQRRPHSGDLAPAGRGDVGPAQGYDEPAAAYAAGDREPAEPVLVPAGDEPDAGNLERRK